MTSSPILCSVLMSSQDQTEDFLGQLRNHLQQIETNVQENLTKLQQRQPFTLTAKKTNEIDENLRKKFLHALKDVANKNNLPFDEPFFRKQVFDTVDASPSLKVENIPTKPSLPTDTTVQPLSPVNNARRSQFAPVLSSTPVHQTSPTMPIPVDLTMATPSVAPTYTMTNNDLPAVPPSAIVPQRAATRPPRLPRAESASRQKKKKDVSTVQEQPADEELIIVTSKRRIERKEENNQIQLVVIEQENTIVTDVVKAVHATPLRGRKKKTAPTPAVEEPIPQLEPPVAPVPIIAAELPPKPSRAGRSKKKEQEPVTKPAEPSTRTSSSRTRKKQEEEEIVVVKEIPSEILPKKSTRSRKKTEETPVPTTKTRSKKKSTTATTTPPPPPPPVVEVPEPVVSLSPKRTNTRSKKRKGNEDQVEENPVSKRRVGGRRMKSVEAAPVPNPAKSPSPSTKTSEIAPISTRSSTRGKKDIEIPIEKQDDIVLKKKPRSGRGKKTTTATESSSVAVVDAPIPTSISMDSIVSKPPRPPVARKKKSIAMPPISQMSPTTPPSAAQRIQSTSPIQDAPLLPLPPVGRRRQAARRGARATSPTDLDEVPSTTKRNQKRSQSSAAATPKRARRDNLILTTVLGTPGKKRNKCTCEKRRHRVCDICATAIDGQ